MRYLFSREREDGGCFKIHIGSRTFRTHVRIQYIFHVARAREEICGKKIALKREDKRAPSMTRRQFLFRHKQNKFFNFASLDLL